MPAGLLGLSAWVGLKSPNVVNAAVFPGPFTASKLALGSGCPSGRSLPGATPPPVVGSREVTLKFVGVERAARETSETQVDPERQELWSTSPALEMASAEFM